MAVRPKSKNDTTKLSPSLTRLCEEDPSLQWHNDPITHKTVLFGISQSHVKMAVYHLQNKFGGDVETSLPKVPYRETIMTIEKHAIATKNKVVGLGNLAGRCWAGQSAVRIRPALQRALNK